MKFENKNISRVVFRHAKSTEGYEYDDYDEIDGKAIKIEDENENGKEKEIVVGNIEAFFMSVDGLGETVYYLLDSISGDHERIAQYFNEENKSKEVILYADKELISKIGQKNGLGDYDDFLKTILLGFYAKIKLFDDMHYSKRDVTVTKKLKKKIIDFCGIKNNLKIF